MKKFLLSCAACAALLTGCTTVESTQRFNAMGLGTPHEKAVCHTFVEIPLYTFFGLPVFGGGNKGDRDVSFFTFSDTAENAVYLLTKEAKSKGAARVINVNVSKTYDVGLLILSRETIQASGTGVRTKAAAIQRAVSDYDRNN